MRATIFLTLLLGCCLASAQSPFFPDTRLPVQRNVLLPEADMPRFPGCEDGPDDPLARRACADQRLNEWLYSRLQYPAEAHQKGIEGTALIRFRITRNGRIEQARIVQDPGGGCGQEALRLAGLMQAAGLRWIPARIDGQPVDAVVNLPVAFRSDGRRYSDAQVLLTGAQPAMTAKSADHPPAYRGDFQDYLRGNLRFPASGTRCEIYDASVSFLVQADGGVTDIQVDRELPTPFREEARRLVEQSRGQWQPARIDGKAVDYRHVVLIPFRDPAADCGALNAHYLLGVQYLDMGHYDGSRRAFRRCLELNPNDVDALLGLGLSEGFLGNLETACSYFTRARRLGSEEGEKLFRTYCH